MSTIPVLFTRRRNLGAVVLRAFQWSPWSHVALVNGPEVIEATATHGVRKASLSDALKGVSAYEYVRLPCLDRNLAYAAAESQIGKGYDWGMILGHPLRQDWDNMDRWVCSELVAWAIREAGTELFRVKPHRVTPQDLYLPRWQGCNIASTYPGGTP